MIIKRIHLLTVLLITFLFTACDPPINGSGAIVTKVATVANFNKVITDLPGKLIVEYVPNTAPTVTLYTQENLLQYIETLVEKDELLLRFKTNIRIGNVDSLIVKVTLPNITAVKLLGNSVAEINNVTGNTEMLAALMGNGAISLNNCTLNKVRAEIAGNGKVSFTTCTSKNAEYALKGNGAINASNNRCDSARAIVAGNGIINCQSTNLDAEINGNGGIVHNAAAKLYRRKIGGNGYIKSIE